MAGDELLAADRIARRPDRGDVARRQAQVRVARRHRARKARLSASTRSGRCPTRATTASTRCSKASRPRTGWHPFYDGDNPIGLRNRRAASAAFRSSRAASSNCPARRTRRSTTPPPNSPRIWRIAAPSAARSTSISSASASTPLWSVADIPAMPKSRYGIMTPYMDKVGTLGTSMMFRSCTVQANLDFSDEADMVKKLRVSLALQPIVTALFANSPFVDGKPSGYLSFRSHIWLDTDPRPHRHAALRLRGRLRLRALCRLRPRRADVFRHPRRQYVNVAGESFRAFLDGKLPQLPGEKPTIKDWEDHLSTLFPEVRLKQFLEMRGADMGDGRPRPRPAGALGRAALRRRALDAAWDLVKDWTAEERQALRDDVPRTALHTPFRDGTVADIARLVVDLARRRPPPPRHERGEDETVPRAARRDPRPRQDPGRALARQVPRRVGRRPHPHLRRSRDLGARSAPTPPRSAAVPCARDCPSRSTMWLASAS